MNTIKNSFKDYLMLEKKYSLHTINGYSNDINFLNNINTVLGTAGFIIITLLTLVLK